MERQHCATRVVLRSTKGFWHFSGQFPAGDDCKINIENMMICVGAYDVHVHVDIHVPNDITMASCHDDGMPVRLNQNNKVALVTARSLEPSPR